MKTIHPSAAFLATLADLPLFAGLAERQRETLLHCAQALAFEPGETLFREGEPAEGFFILKTGRAKIRRLSPSGHEVVFQLAAPPHMIGCKGLTLPGSRYPADGVAVDAVIALRFTRERFLRSAADTPDVFFSLLVDMNRRLSEIFTMQSALQEPVEQRIATLLLNQALPRDVDPDEWRGQSVREIRITKSLIAAIVGTSTETAIRILSKWRKQGLIRSQRGKIEIEDLEAIHDLTLGPLEPADSPARPAPDGCRSASSASAKK